jgi:tetratricopeptide repeat protein
MQVSRCDSISYFGCPEMPQEFIRPRFTRSCLFFHGPPFVRAHPRPFANFEKAIALLRKTIEIDPKRALAYLNLGDVFVKLNRIVEARQAYTKYLELVLDSQSAADVRKKLAALAPSPSR